MLSTEKNASDTLQVVFLSTQVVKKILPTPAAGNIKTLKDGLKK